MDEIEDILKDHSQIDPQFRTQRCYLKVSASYIRKTLIFQKGYQLSDFCERSMNNILNRLGYTLKKVLKTQPLKKIAQTDAIFANISAQHTKAKNNPRILRISIDTKAKVKVGNLSRGGYSRMLNAPVADDHDQKWDAVLVPLGIQEINTDDLYFIFGNSKETSDFIVDGLEMWWESRQFNEASFDSLMIDLDNGKSVASNTKLFIKRITAFAQKIGMPIQLVYYPPYHSKYNPVERVWAALENYWSAIILDSVQNTLKVAQQMTYKGINPIVKFIDKTYHKGVKVSAKKVKELEQNFILRNPDLRLWDVTVNYSLNA